MRSPGLTRPVDAVLFDLDGTLVDSAPDLAGAINELRAARDLAPLPYATLRPMVGTGARGMIGVAFARQPGDTGYEDLREEFLQRYGERLLQLTTVFDTMGGVLQALDDRGMPWGIVTNKATRYARALTLGLGLHSRAAVLIAGDTTAHAKPHPAPLLAAAEHMGLPPERCVYVGDDERDVQAGRAAGMRTLAASWGYLGQGAGIHHWGADAVIDSPPALLKWLELD